MECLEQSFDSATGLARETIAARSVQQELSCVSDVHHGVL